MSMKEQHKALEVIDYFYDSNPTEEDLMGIPNPQLDLMRYLLDVLDEYHKGTGWFDTGELNLYYTNNSTEYPNTPDVLSFRPGIVPLTRRGKLKSWRIAPPQQMPPTVVIEIASEGTWEKDILPQYKPTTYGIMGVSEYFAYDPNVPQVWNNVSTRLRGWRYAEGKAQEIPPDEQGWLWSEELQSWLVPNNCLLQLHDSEFRLRLTDYEAQEQATKMAEAREQAALEREQVALVEKEKAQAEKEKAQAELAKLLERLRQQGIDLN